MERRTLLKNVFVLGSGAILIPSCMQKDRKASLPLKHLEVSAQDEKLLAEIKEIILPASATPGAKDVYAHHFTLRMVDDCYNREAQQAFQKGLRQVDELSKKQHGRAFVDCDARQRTEVISLLDTRKGPEEANECYRMAKELTIQAFLSSKQVMTSILKYEMVPGRYNGAFPVTKRIIAA